MVKYTEKNVGIQGNLVIANVFCQSIPWLFVKSRFHCTILSAYSPWQKQICQASSQFFNIIFVLQCFREPTLSTFRFHYICNQKSGCNRESTPHLETFLPTPVFTCRRMWNWSKNNSFRVRNRFTNGKQLCH